MLQWPGRGKRRSEREPIGVRDSDLEHGPRSSVDEHRRSSDVEPAGRGKIFGAHLTRPFGGHMESSVSCAFQVAKADRAAPQLPPGDYTLHVKIIEATNLAARDTWGTSDPFVSVRLENQTQQTHVNYKCLACTWGTTMIFKLPALTMERAAMLSLQMEVRDADGLLSDLIGVCELEIMYLWSLPSRALWHAWFALFTSEAEGTQSTVDKKTKGFLRINAALLGPGRVDALPVEPEQELAEERRIHLPPTNRLHLGTLCVDVLGAIGLKSNTSARSLRAVVCLRFEGKTLRTFPAPVDQSSEPSEARWDQKLRMPVATPTLGDRIALVVRAHLQQRARYRA